MISEYELSLPAALHKVTVVTFNVSTLGRKEHKVLTIHYTMTAVTY